MHRGLKMTPWEDRQLIEAFDEEFEELVHFAAGSVVDCGFGYMDRNGVVDPSKPEELSELKLRGPSHSARPKSLQRTLRPYEREEHGRLERAGIEFPPR